MISTEQREIQELQKRGPFKALPLNKKILEPKGDGGKSSVATSKMEATKFKEFHLSSTMKRQISDPVQDQNQR